MEQIGVGRAKEQAEQADLILYVVDTSCELDESDVEICKILEKKKAIIVLNKSDLQIVVTEDQIREKIGSQHPVISISAKQKEGIQYLEDTIRDLFFKGKLSFNDEFVLTNIRHKTALEDAKKSLEMVLDSILNGMPEDFYTIDLMDAYHSLGTILGEDMGEDLIQEIFSKFCTGK